MYIIRNIKVLKKIVLNMGALFLYHKSCSIEERQVREFYKKKGFINPFIFDLGEYRLLLYKKQLVDVNNYYSLDSVSLYVCGSLFYKGLNYEHSLKELLLDYRNECVSANDLYGNYVCLFYNSQTKKITFCLDPAFAKNVYYSTKLKIISSNYLAILECLDSWSINELAIAENLTTGHLISPDTYVNEIQKIDKINFHELDNFFPNLETRTFTPKVIERIERRKDALRHANEMLSQYFSAVKNIAHQFGAHIGLTGGFDSRLLLMHAKKYITNLITNSFWRENSIEYEIAKNLAYVANVPFYAFENGSFEAPPPEHMMKKSFYFFDGQIRSQNNWDEVFNLPEYAAQIAYNHFVGFHGSGGEQYRNADRLIGSIPFNTYVKYEWMFKQSFNFFKDKELERAIFNRISAKIRRLTGISDNRIGLLELKIIQNEVWNTANRLTRVNVLNQQQFYFAPFTEYQLSHAAYSYVPYLGPSLAFQIDLLNNLDRELSEVRTNYGFRIDKGEPLKMQLVPYAMKIVPRSLFYWFYKRWKKYQRITGNQKEIYITNPYLLDLGRKIDLKKLGENKNLRSGLRAFDFLLNKIRI